MVSALASSAAMVACQMMSAAPERIASATLLGTTLTGWEMLIPLHLRPVRLAKVSLKPRLVTTVWEGYCLMENLRTRHQVCQPCR